MSKKQSGAHKKSEASVSGAHKYHDYKMHKVMHEYKHGELHSGSKKGPKVTSRKQAIAIAMSEARKGKK